MEKSSIDIFDKNFKEISDKIAVAAKKSGRCPQDIILLAATKTVDVEVINHAIKSGIKFIGENRVQEFLSKYENYEPVHKHFIGHLQTNKVKQIVPFVHMIHSVDSMRLLETINREAEKIARRVKVLLEVHVAKEETKSGFTPDEINQFIIHNSKFIIDYPWVEICGVMGMATNTDDEKEWRRCFREISSLASKLSTLNTKQVSMGMSDDYLIAIQEGSTMIRIGSTIFGSRL